MYTLYLYLQSLSMASLVWCPKIGILRAAGVPYRQEPVLCLSGFALNSRGAFVTRRPNVPYGTNTGSGEKNRLI